MQMKLCPGRRFLPAALTRSPNDDAAERRRPIDATTSLKAHLVQVLRRLRDYTTRRGSHDQRTRARVHLLCDDRDTPPESTRRALIGGRSELAVV